jgi:hypothetical protein
MCYHSAPFTSLSSQIDGDRKTFNVKSGVSSSPRIRCRLIRTEVSDDARFLQMTVDTDITSPFQFDWYLQSHASLLGTGRSAHYTVLADESNYSSDALQALAYNLCVLCLHT